jgi:hypothetical protein
LRELGDTRLPVDGLALTLARWAYERRTSGLPFPTAREASEVLGCKVQHVYDALSRLARRGWLRRIDDDPDNPKSKRKVYALREGPPPASLYEPPPAAVRARGIVAHYHQPRRRRENDYLALMRLLDSCKHEWPSVAVMADALGIPAGNPTAVYNKVLDALRTLAARGHLTCEVATSRKHRAALTWTVVYPIDWHAIPRTTEQDLERMKLRAQYDGAKA